MPGKEKITEARLYTSKEVLDKLKDIHADMITNTAKEKDGQMAMVELLVCAKIIGKLQEAIENGEF